MIAAEISSGPLPADDGPACTQVKCLYIYLEAPREPPLRLDGVERCAEAVRDRHGPDAKAVA